MKRLARALAIALVSAVFVLPTPVHSEARFNPQQDKEVQSTGWVFYGVWDYEASEWQETGFEFGSFDYDYTLTLDNWVGHFIYDFDVAGWEEVVFELRVEG